jgi:hypothetical protein
MQPTSTTMPPSSRVMDGLVVPDIISSRWRLSGLDGCLTQFNRNTKTTLYIHLVGCNLSLNLVGDRRINRGRSRNGAGPDPDERRFCFPDRHVGWAIHISGFRSLSLPPRSESSVSARASCWSSAFLAADGCNGTLYIVQRHAAARRDRDRLHEFYLFCPLGRLGGRATVLCRRSPGSSLFSHLSLTSTSGPIRGDLDVGSALLRRARLPNFDAVSPRLLSSAALHRPHQSSKRHCAIAIPEPIARDHCPGKRPCFFVPLLIGYFVPAGYDVIFRVIDSLQYATDLSGWFLLCIFLPGRSFAFYVFCARLDAACQTAGC